MTMLTNWTEIQETDEYKDDVAILQKRFSQSLGTKYFSKDSVFAWLITHLTGIRRYFIRHLPDLQDVDESPRLDLLQDDIGFHLPLTSSIPMSELLRQSAAWFELEGNPQLIYYIGSLVGSEVEIFYPKDLIFKLSSSRSALSGALSNSGPLPLHLSKQARIRDGIFWAKYVYQVIVLQAQNIENITDLYNLLDFAHPAGFQMFVRQESNYINEGYSTEDDELLESLEFEMSYLLEHSWPTLDNGFKLSAGRGKLSMHNGDYLLTGEYWEEITEYLEDSDINRFSNDEYTHAYDLDSPWIGFSRFISNGDGTETEVFSDNDAIVYENVTTNVGLFSYPIEVIMSKTFRQLQHAAMDKDQKNMKGTWLQELMWVDVEEL